MSTSEPNIVGFVEDITDEDEGEVPLRAFALHGERYYVAGQAPAGALIDLAKMAMLEQDPNNTRKMAEMMVTLSDFLDAVMMPESAVRFAARMRTPIKPVTAKTIMRLTRWLVSVYSGKEDTAPSSSSPDGSPPTGPSSTVGALPGGSTPGSFH